MKNSRKYAVSNLDSKDMFYIIFNKPKTVIFLSA